MSERGRDGGTKGRSDGGKKIPPRGARADAWAFVASALPETVVPLVAPAEFLEAAAGLGVEFEAGEVERLGLYLALLIEANKSVNLTGVTEPAEAWRRHILDSLTLLPMLAELGEGAEGAGGARVIDVGSGGGLPGVPLAIVMPGVRFTLLEATGKKAEFLRAAAARLGLKNVEVVAERAEAAGHDPRHRERYDAAVARAVGPTAVIAELTVPFARIGGGRVLLIKGQKAEEELAAAKAALHKLHAVHVGTVETPNGRVVVLEKRRRTPAAYPRRAGEPKLRPL
ncbi:MAG: 16S rRNA (guanine(527)-N(7))-methyltransferase RsmG [Phycisphaerales bacterium]